MKDGRESSPSLFSLFKGRIEGSVQNPMTGNVHPRKHVMALYRQLIGMSIDDPANRRLQRLLRMVADLLEIPHDIHDRLIMEAWKNRKLLGEPDVSPFVRADIEAMYNLMTGDTYSHGSARQEGKSPDRKKSGIERGPPGLFDDHSGIFDAGSVDEYSILSEMEADDISLVGSSGIMESGRDSPFRSSGWVKPAGGRDHGTFG